jgi:CheY-like chemotaxis protein
MTYLDLDVMNKILVVENNDDSRRLMVRLLASLGYDVLEADDGTTAWDLIQKQPVPVIITDWMMDEMDGLELVETIRAAEMPYYIYVIMVTASGNSTDASLGYAVGADDFLSKPVNLDDLQARVERGFYKFREINNLNATNDLVRQEISIYNNCHL